MEKYVLNYFVDLGLAITFIASGVTGIIKYPGFVAAIGLDFRLLFGAYLNLIHDTSGVAMVALVCIHLFLHRQWIVSMTKAMVLKPENRKKALICFLGLIIFLAVIAIALNL